jgi:hypothetical protein
MGDLKAMAVVETKLHHPPLTLLDAPSIRFI